MDLCRAFDTISESYMARLSMALGSHGLSLSLSPPANAWLIQSSPSPSYYVLCSLMDLLFTKPCEIHCREALNTSTNVQLRDQSEMPSRLIPTRGLHADGVPVFSLGSWSQVAPLTPAQHLHVPFTHVPYAHDGEQFAGRGTARGAVAALCGSVPGAAVAAVVALGPTAANQAIRALYAGTSVGRAVEVATAVPLALVRHSAGV